MYTIKNGWVLNSSGQKLPRTEAHQVLQSMNVQRPSELYLIANQLEDMVKVGISHQPIVRKGQLEQRYPQLGRLKILQTCRFMSDEIARSAESNIHEFLTELGRGPVLDREWFKPCPHDMWLIRWLMNEMPTYYMAHGFGEMIVNYIELLAEYPTNPEYIAEEILLGYGSAVYSHFRHETGYKGEVGFKKPVIKPVIFALPASA